MRLLRGPKRAVSSVDFSPDGTRLAAGAEDGTVWVFDLLAGTALSFEAGPVDGHPRELGVVARFAPSGRQLVVGDGLALVWVADAADGARAATLHAESVYDGLRELRFTTDGRLVTAAEAAGMAAFDAVTWEPVPFAPPPGPRRAAFAVEPGGHRAALADGTLIDLRTGAAVGQWARPHVVATELEWCPSRPVVAVVGEAGSVHIYDPDALARHAAARRATLMPPTRKYTNAVAFTPDGNTLITVGNDGVARLYDTNTWAERAAYNWKAGPLKCVAVSPDGTQAAAGGGDSKRGKVVVWDLE